MPPTDDENPFALLGVARRFDVDLDELQRSFLKASAAVHPDRFSDPAQQVEMAAKAAKVNRAYRRLKEPESRAVALLEALGGPRGDQDKSLPPGLLEEMLEVHEKMAEAQGTDDKPALAELEEWGRQRIQATLEKVGRLFADALAAPTGAGQTAALRAIRQQLNALRYYQRLIEQMDPDYDPHRLG